MVNAILLRPLPAVPEASRLAALYTIDPRTPGFLYCSYPNYKDYRDRNSVFSSLLLYTGLALNVSGRSEPQMVMGQMVSGNYFQTLGVRPAIGRGFLPEEDAAPGERAVAVVSYRFWQRHFGASAAMAGRTVTLNGRPYDVVGVAPPGFEGLDTLTATDIWVPFSMYPYVYPNISWVNQRRALVFLAVGRLKPGIGMAQAAASLDLLARDLEREYPRDNKARRLRLAPVEEAALPPQSRPVISRAGVVLMVISALVLLIACGNVANLLLARAAGRSREITVRLAMGASRWRLIRQFLAESLLLALAGGALGLLLARWARDLLWSVRPPMFSIAAVHMDLNGRVLAYTLAVSVATGVLFGLAPALRATRTNLAADLKERTGRTAPAGRRRPRSLLVMGQVALSVIALCGASLFLRSLNNASHIDPGFDIAHTGVVIFNVAESGYSEERGREFQRMAVENVAAVPGVVSASLARDWPFQVSLRRTVLLEGSEDAAGAEGRRALMESVSPGHLRTAGIPLLSGRDISPLDTAGAPRVAIVNQAAAARFWPGERPEGKRIRFFGENLPLEVVGVARNASYFDLGEPPQAMIYVSASQYYSPLAALWVRSAGDPDRVLQAARARVHGLDRNLLLQAQSTGSILKEQMWAQRLSAGLLAAFGLLALLLASVGIYGVISYSVHQRGREIGVRMALGASSTDVKRMVLREGLLLVAGGGAAGLLVALGSARTVESLLYATGGRDALTFAVVPAVLALVAVAACWLPARRATRIDPAVSLRDE
jgi:predicted permease